MCRAGGPPRWPASRGTVRSVTLRPRVNVPALVVDLYDGSQALNLVWLGRRTIGGIEPGTYLPRAAG